MIPTELAEKCHCPACGAILTRGETADPWAICLVCPEEHRFFVMPDGPLAVDSATASSAHFPQLQYDTSERVAAFWLSEPSARSILVEQLAMLLRVYLEQHFPAGAVRFSFCPICAAVLSNVPHAVGDAGWALGRACPDGHRWAERNGLGRMFGGMHFSLQREPLESEVKRVVAFWLDGDYEARIRLHHSVRDVLAEFPFARLAGA